MNTALRANVQELASESVGSIKDAILGKSAMTDRVKEAIRVIGLGSRSST